MLPSGSGSERPSRREILGLAGLLVAAFLLRVVAFVGATDGDAPLYAELSARPLSGVSQDLISGGTTVGRVGVLLPTRAAFLALGSHERAAAVFPMICALGMVVLAWILARRAGGPVCAVLAAALVALCPHHLAWSTVLGADIPAGFWMAMVCVLADARAVGAGLCLGMAVATRESSLTLLPFLLAVAARRAPSGRRGSAVLVCLAAVLAGLWIVAPDGRMFRILGDYFTGSFLDRASLDAEGYAGYLRDLGVSRPWMRWFTAPLMLLPGDPRFQAFGGIATLGLLGILGMLAGRLPGRRWVAAWALAHALFLLMAASPRSPGHPLLVGEPRYLEHLLVPCAVGTALLLHAVLKSRAGLALACWGIYLLYAGWVGVVQARGSSKVCREVGAWMAARPQEPVLYADRFQVPLLRFLAAYAPEPRFDYALRYFEYHDPGRPYRPAPLMPGGLLLVVDDKGVLGDGVPSPADRGWPEAARWSVVTEVGPRAALADLTGRPRPPLPTKEVVLYRIPQDYLKTR